MPSIRTVGDAYPLSVMAGPAPMVLDWGPLLEAVLVDVRRGIPAGVVAGRFHNALVEGILAVATGVGEPRVALTGGCFQNRILTERAAARLEGAGFRGAAAPPRARERRRHQPRSDRCGRSPPGRRQEGGHLMCLGVPGKILEMWDDATGMKMGRVSFGGIVKEVCLWTTPKPKWANT